jgi:hypothetical protein
VQVLQLLGQLLPKLLLLILQVTPKAFDRQAVGGHSHLEHAR